MQEDGETVPCFIFFKIIATPNESYTGDFFRMTGEEKGNRYYISLHSLSCNKDILVEMATTAFGAWEVQYKSCELCPELQDFLIRAVSEYETNGK